MGFQDVASLPSRTRFSSMFLNNGGGGESLGTTTCLRTVVGCNQGHAPCKVFKLQQSLFLWTS